MTYIPTLSSSRGRSQATLAAPGENVPRKFTRPSVGHMLISKPITVARGKGHMIGQAWAHDPAPVAKAGARRHDQSTSRVVFAEDGARQWPPPG